MKKNSWKTLLSVLLLLAMLVSMLPFAAFAEDGQTAAAQTEEPAKTEDVPKVEEKTGDTPKADGKTDATKTDEKSGDTVKDESKDVPKDDAAKDGSKDAPKDDAAKDENKDTPIGDTEQPAKGSSEDAAPKTVDITLTYDANGGTGSWSETKTFNVGEEYTFTVKSRFDTGIDRAKHAFRYWTIDKAGERDRYNGNNQITVTGDTTLYAQWQYVPQKINILYSPNYSSVEPVVSESATEGESYPVLGSNTFRPPYNKHFVNWNTASDGSGTPYEADSVITAPGNDLTLYAQWADDPKWSELGIDISAPAKALPGDGLTYAIKVTNGTGYDLNSVVVDVALPAEVTYDASLSSSGAWGFSYDSGTHTVTARLESADDSPVLALNGTSDFSLPVTINPAVFGTIEAKATIASAFSRTGRSETGEGKSDTARTTMSGLDISVTAAPENPTLGETITYTVTVTNNTGLTLSGITINNGMNSYDSISMLSLQSSLSDGWDLTSTSEGNLCNFYRDLAPGASSSYKLTTSFINADNKTAVCTAAITSLSAGGSTVSGSFGSASAAAALKELDWSKLKIEKTVDKTSARPGDTLTYTVEVTNNTDTDLDEVYVEDFLPGTLAYTGSTLVDGATGTLSHDSQLGTVTAKVTGLKKGAAAKYTVTAKVNADASGEINSLAKITKAVRGTDTVDITTTKEASAKTTVYTPVPVNVKVIFNGLKDVSQVPANYTLTGADSNIFPKGDLKGNIALGTAVKDASGQISRTFTTTADVILGQEYSLSFTQSDYDIPGYICTLTTETDPIKVTAQDAIAGINAEITLSYVKENLYTYPSLTVRTYFKGLAKLPDSFGYKLNCVSAPEDAIAFQGPLALTPGTESGVPYLEFSAKNVTLQAGTELTFSFTQSGYDVPGYLCALGSSTFKFTLPVPTTDVRQPILLKIENTYNQPDWSKLTITKTADKTSATPGSVVNYTVTVTNNTGVDLSDIIVADKLDSRLRYSDSTGDYDTGTGTWTVASLANGKSVTLTLTVKLKYALAAGTVIENTASVTEAAAAGLIYDLSGQKLNDSVSVTVTSGKGSPKTGDESNLGLWIAVMAASLACAGAAAVIYKKRRG